MPVIRVPLLSLSLLTLGLVAAGANPPQMNKGLYDLGSSICADIANGAMDFPAAKAPLERVDELNWERSEFCHCVGSEFGLNTAQQARMAATSEADMGEVMAEILTANLLICEPGERAYGYNPKEADDILQCEETLAGRRNLPGFDLKRFKTAMQDEARDPDGLCDCTAGYIATIESLIDVKPPSAEQLTPSYKMHLATGMQVCLTAQ